MKHRRKRRRSNNSAGRSRYHITEGSTTEGPTSEGPTTEGSIIDLTEDADDFSYSALHEKDQTFPMSDEKYAQALQLQEALIFSVSQPNASSSSTSKVKDEASTSKVKDEASTSNVNNEASTSQVNNEASTSQVKDEPSSWLMIKYEASSSLIEDEPISSLNSETSSPQNKLNGKQPMERDEPAAKLPIRSFCGICMDTKAPSEMFSINKKVCRHLYCLDCIRQHVSVKINENISKVKCPQRYCKGLIGPELCRPIVPKEVIERWEDALCESMILASYKFYCPYKDCSAMFVDGDDDEDVTRSECPRCNRLFCAQCKVPWHRGMDCREYNKSLKKGDRNPEDLMAMQLAKNNMLKKCPFCNIYVEKQGGFDIVICGCGKWFCYICAEKGCVCSERGQRRQSQHNGAGNRSTFGYIC